MAQPMKNFAPKTKQRLALISKIILLAYVSVYPILSFNGRYSSQPVISGKMRLANGFAIRDIYVWEPKYVELYPYGFNALGAIYWELIWVDRKFWHIDKPAYSTPSTGSVP